MPLLKGFDGPLAFGIFILCCMGLITMYSSGFANGARFIDHGRNMLIAGFIMFVVAQIPPQRLMALAVPLYTVGVALLIAVALFGLTKKGARRWLNIGVVIQPSEIMKIAMPLMVVSKTRRPIAPPRFFGRRCVAVGACGFDRQATRSGHRHLGVVCGHGGVVLCRPELVFDRATHCVGVDRHWLGGVV
jgi:cell division protein FtsW (lipid II flippase)